MFLGNCVVAELSSVSVSPGDANGMWQSWCHCSQRPSKYQPEGPLSALKVACESCHSVTLVVQGTPPVTLHTPTLHHQTGLQSPSPLWSHQASCVFIHGERGHFSRFTKAVRHTVTRVVKNRKAILMTSKKQNTNWHSLHAMAEFLQNIATGWWCGCYCWACFSNGRILEVTKWGLLGLM